MTPREIFYAHLDVCKQCDRRPFGMCQAGQQLLVEAVQAELAERGADGRPMLVVETSSAPFPAGDPRVEAQVLALLEAFVAQGAHLTQVVRALLHAAAVTLGHTHQGLRSSDQLFGADMAAWLGSVLTVAHQHRTCEIDAGGRHRPAASTPAHQVH